MSRSDVPSRIPPSTDDPARNMRVQRIENMLVVVHTTEAPNDREWRSYLDVSLAMGRDLGGDLRRGKMLVVTDGGSPGIAQRSQAVKAAEQMYGARMPIGVLSCSRFVRILVTSAGVVLNMKAFSPPEVQGLFDFLGLSYLAARPVWAELERIDRALGGLATISEARRAFERW